MSERYAESSSSKVEYGIDYFTSEFATLTKFHGSFTNTAMSSDFTEEEKEQITESRENIASGKTQRFKNSEEYLKSLDEDND